VVRYRGRQVEHEMKGNEEDGKPRQRARRPMIIL
jgi:hypothetical protein